MTGSYSNKQTQTRCDRRRDCVDIVRCSLIFPNTRILSLITEMHTLKIQNRKMHDQKQGVQNAGPENAWRTKTHHFGIFGPGRRIPKHTISEHHIPCWNQFTNGPKIPKAFLIRSGAQTKLCVHTRAEIAHRTRYLAQLRPSTVSDFSLIFSLMSN